MSVLTARSYPFVAIVFALCAFGCGKPAGPMSHDGFVQVVMNPDSTAFAYALDYHRYPRWLSLDRTSAARVEVWTYDLARRSGPHKIGCWSHDPKLSASLLSWTDKGLYLGYPSFAKAGCEEIDPRSGGRHHLPHVPWDYLRSERRGGPDSNDPDEYQQVRHIEARCGEFLVWDPVNLKSTLLFALPIDENLSGSSRDYAIQCRETALRQDGVQSIARIVTLPASHGLTFHIQTFAKRPAAFVRRYTLHLDLQVPEPGDLPYETIVGGEAVLDTTIAPNRAGDDIALYVPYKRFLKVLRPNRGVMQRYGSKYSTNVAATLIPDSLAGDDRLPPGIRDGAVTDTWTYIDIPLP